MRYFIPKLTAIFSTFSLTQTQAPLKEVRLEFESSRIKCEWSSGLVFTIYVRPFLTEMSVGFFEILVLCLKYFSLDNEHDIGIV